MFTILKCTLKTSKLMCRADHDLILDGIHENILQLNYHDPLMQKSVSIYCPLQIYRDSIDSVGGQTVISICLKVKCLNSVGVSDLLRQYIMRTHQMSLQGKIIFFACFNLIAKIKSHASFSLSFLQFICPPQQLLYIAKQRKFKNQTLSGQGPIKGTSCANRTLC